MDQHPFSSDQHLRDRARFKSFTWHALLVFVLYLCFWLPGYIANWLFWGEANRMERLAGERLPGTGFLRFLLWFHNIILGLGLLVGLLILGSIAHSHYDTSHKPSDAQTTEQPDSPSGAIWVSQESRREGVVTVEEGWGLFRDEDGSVHFRAKVVNGDNQPVKRVMVIVDFLDAAGHSLDSAMPFIDQIGQGETAHIDVPVTVEAICKASLASIRVNAPEAR